MSDEAVGTQITKRDTLGTSESQSLTEVSARAIGEAQKAAIAARYQMAMANPRDMENVRVRLLKECSRPGFADAAIYAKPQGKNEDGTQKFVEGFSIRFAEAALLCLTNTYSDAAVLYDDADKRIVRSMVMDLESNTTFAKDIVVTKTVERRFLKKGQEPIMVRTNDYGDRVYIVPGTDDQILNKEASLSSKAMRTSALRLVPGDIKEECMAKCNAVLADRASKDPDGERRRMIDAFAAQNVYPTDLAAYLGHDVGKCSPAETEVLRKLFVAVRDRETSWSEIMAEKTGAAAAEGGVPAAGSLKEKLEAKAAAKKTAAAAAPAPQADAPKSTTPSNESDDERIAREQADLFDKAHP